VAAGAPAQRTGSGGRAAAPPSSARAGEASSSSPQPTKAAAKVVVLNKWAVPEGGKGGGGERAAQTYYSSGHVGGGIAHLASSSARRFGHSSTSSPAGAAAAIGGAGARRPRGAGQLRGGNALVPSTVKPENSGAGAGVCMQRRTGLQRAWRGSGAQGARPLRRARGAPAAWRAMPAREGGVPRRRRVIGSRGCGGLRRYRWAGRASPKLRRFSESGVLWRAGDQGRLRPGGGLCAAAGVRGGGRGPGQVRVSRLVYLPALRAPGALGRALAAAQGARAAPCTPEHRDTGGTVRAAPAQVGLVKLPRAAPRRAGAAPARPRARRGGPGPASGSGAAPGRASPPRPCPEASSVGRARHAARSLPAARARRRDRGRTRLPVPWPRRAPGRAPAPLATVLLPRARPRARHPRRSSTAKRVTPKHDQEACEAVYDLEGVLRQSPRRCPARCRPALQARRGCQVSGPRIAPAAAAARCRAGGAAARTPPARMFGGLFRGLLPVSGAAPHPRPPPPHPHPPHQACGLLR
jgi:hypothetical protein